MVILVVCRRITQKSTVPAPHGDFKTNARCAVFARRKTLCHNVFHYKKNLTSKTGPGWPIELHELITIITSDWFFDSNFWKQSLSGPGSHRKNGTVWSSVNKKEGVAIGSQRRDMDDLKNIVIYWIIWWWKCLCQCQSHQTSKVLWSY